MMTTLFGVVEAKLLASAVDGPLRIVDAAGAPATWDSISRAWTLGDLSSGGGQEHPIGAPIVAAMLGDAALLREAFDERGADVAARHAATGATTVMHAAGAGAADAVDFLLNHAKARGLSRLVDAGTSKLGITPLDRAVRCGHADVVRLLLRHGASVAVARSSGCTPLHAAAEMGRCECAAAAPGRRGCGCGEPRRRDAAASVRERLHALWLAGGQGRRGEAAARPWCEAGRPQPRRAHRTRRRRRRSQRRCGRAAGGRVWIG